MSFTCPKCGMESHHPDDARHGYCVACREFTLRAFLDEVVDSEDRVLVFATGIVWEGHIVSASSAGADAIVRPAGLEGEFKNVRWLLEEIEEIARKDAGDEDQEDPLQKYARRLRSEASAYAELTLAERMVLKHINRRKGDDDLSRG